MNIGIDIDGVVTKEKKGQENIWLRALNNYFSKKIIRKKDVYDFKRAYDLPLEDLQEFLNQKLYDVYSSVDIADNAKETIDHLIKNGHTIYLITARHQEFRPLTIKWLQQHDVNYNYLFHEHNKADLAVEKNIKLFIEDNQSNTAQLLEKNIPVILVDKYHNQNIKEQKKLLRVNNWLEIQSTLKILLPSLIKQDSTS